MEHFSHSPSYPRWFVLQTKPLQEARVLASLQLQHIACFLPMLNEVGDGAEPLFPRYLFVRLNSPAAAADVRAVDGVTRLLKLNNEFAPVPESLILALQGSYARDGEKNARTWSHASGAYPVLASMQNFSSAARGLKMIELVCQPESLRSLTNPMRMAA